MGQDRQKREYHVTFQEITGQILTESVTIQSEYLAGNLILKAKPGRKLIHVTCVRMFQTVCPITGTLIFEGDPTREKNGKIVARNDF